MFNRNYLFRDYTVTLRGLFQDPESLSQRRQDDFAFGFWLQISLPLLKVLDTTEKPSKAPKHDNSFQVLILRRELRDHRFSPSTNVCGMANRFVELSLIDLRNFQFFDFPCAQWSESPCYSMLLLNLNNQVEQLKSQVWISYFGWRLLQRVQLRSQF